MSIESLSLSIQTFRSRIVCLFVCLSLARIWHRIVDGIKTVDDLDTYAKELAATGIPCVYNGALLPTHDVADKGFKLMITGGGHALSYAAVRQALLALKEPGAEAEGRDQEQFDSITSLLGLPEVYELERRYAVGQED